jgi:hypothetical protein
MGNSSKNVILLSVKLSRIFYLAMFAYHVINWLRDQVYQVTAIMRDIQSRYKRDLLLLFLRLVAEQVHAETKGFGLCQFEGSSLPV